MRSKSNIFLVFLMSLTLLFTGCGQIGGGKDEPTGPAPVAGDTQAPSIPTLSVTVKSDTAIDLSWTASTDDNAVSHYDIYRNGALITNSTGTTYSDSGLTADTAYCYKVKAFDPNGNGSAFSNEVCKKTGAVYTASGTYIFNGVGVVNGLSMTWTASTFPCCGPELNKTDTVTVNSMTASSMTWEMQDGPVTWTKISGKPATSAATSIIGTWTATIDGDLFEGTFTSNKTVTVKGTLMSSSPGPQDLNISSSTSNSATLSWSAPPQGTVDSYNVYKGGTLLTGGVMMTSYTATGLMPGTQYCFTVTATYTDGIESPESNEACVTPGQGGGTGGNTPPTVPGNLMAMGQSTSIMLSWMPSTDNTYVASYEVWRDGIWYAMVNGTQTYYSDNGAMTGMTHCYKVQAVDSTGLYSAPSAQACAMKTTGGGGGGGVSYSASGNFSFMGVGYPGGLQINWTYSNFTMCGPIPGPTEYHTVDFINPGVMQWDGGPEVGGISWTTPSANPQGVLYGTWNMSDPYGNTYTANFTSGTGGNYIDLTGTIVNCDQSGGGDTMPPSMPTGLMANGQPSMIMLSWGASYDDYGVMSYDIFRDGMWQATVPGYQATFTDYSPVPGMTHCYFVQAIDSAWNYSPPSNQACAMAQQAPPPGGGGGFIGFDNGQMPTDWVPNNSSPYVQWHVQSYRYMSPGYALRYGTVSNQFSFNDAGMTNWGEVTMPPVMLNPNASLSFNYYLDGECPTGTDCYFDTLGVYISIDNGTSWTMLKPSSQPDIVYGLKDNAGPAAPSMNDVVNFDLSAYAGMNVQIKFRFDTIDGAVNDYEGAYIDNVNLNPGVKPKVDFEDGTLQGWQATGLWHATGTGGYNSTYSAWYADPTSGTFDFPVGTANSGTLTSPTVQLGASPKLKFAYSLQNECGNNGYGDGSICYFDALTVLVSKDGGMTWTQLDSANTSLPVSNGFTTMCMDLTAYANMPALIRFNFDTKDGIGNMYDGARVDDIEAFDGTCL